MRSDEKQSSRTRPKTTHSHPQSDEESPRQNRFWSVAFIVFSVIAGIASIIGVLPLFGISTVWSLQSHPITASSIATSTPTRIPNMCGSGTGSSNPTIGFTFCTYRGHKGPVHAVAWSPDGKRVASGGQDGTVQYGVL